MDKPASTSESVHVTLATQALTPPPEKKEDKQLERLYDYTKFHIGIYMSAAGALAAVISAAANKDTGSAFKAALSGAPVVLLLAFAFMLLAGVCGACVATSAIENKTYEDFNEKKQGFLWFNFLPGKIWVKLEHLSFWLSLFCVTVVVFAAPNVQDWVNTSFLHLTHGKIFETRQCATYGD